MNPIAESSNGRTPDFDSGNRGSSPRSASTDLLELVESDIKMLWVDSKDQPESVQQFNRGQMIALERVKGYLLKGEYVSKLTRYGEQFYEFHEKRMYGKGQEKT